jgi:aminoglycoside phosphotransferase (APT) family kinase protein
MPPLTLDADIGRWVESLTAGRLNRATRQAGGTSRESYELSVAAAQGEELFFLKIDHGQGPLASTSYTLKREYEVLQRLGEFDVPAPHVIGYHEEFRALLMARLTGSADLRSVEDPGERLSIENSLIEALVKLHAIAVSRIDLPFIAPGLSRGAALKQDMKAWQDIYRGSIKQPELPILYAFAWLEQNIPDQDDKPAVIVHGDIGSGNFLFHDGAVTGLVDWELAHVGHPLEDIACIMSRSLNEPLGDHRRLLALYEILSGEHFPPSDVLICLIAVLVRFAVPMALAVERRALGVDLPLLLGFFQSTKHAILELIAKNQGVDLAESGATDAADSLDLDIEYELAYLEHVLKTIVQPAVSEAGAMHRLQGAINILKYVRRVRVLPPRQEVQDHAPAGSEDELRRAYAQSCLRHELMKDVLGGMYARRLVI